MNTKILLVITTAFVGLCGADTDPPPNFSGKDVTHTLFGDTGSEDFFPVAFGDFNADKLTDIFTVSKNRSTIALYLAREEEPLFTRQSACDIRTLDNHGHPTLGVPIKGVSLGDFNGDGMLDVMVTLKQPGAHGCVEVQIFPGNGTDIDCFHPWKSTDRIEMYQEPLIVDVDGDMIMDLIGEEFKCINSTSTTPESTTNPAPPKNKRLKKVWRFLPGKQIRYENYTININTDDVTNEIWQSIEASWYDINTVEINKPSSNAIVDIDHDTVPELIVLTVNTNSSIPTSHPMYYLESYRIGVNSKYEWEFRLFNIIPLEESIKSQQVQAIGQPMFIDMNQDGNLLHILPYCTDKVCKNSKFKVISWGTRNHTDLDVSFEDENGVTWSFLKINENGSQWFDMYLKTGLVYRVGDYNMDGYPDLMGVIMSEKGPYVDKHFRPVIFENVPCVAPNPTKPCPFPRTFRIDFQSLSAYENVTMATFFDIYDDGLIDVLLVRRTNPDTHVGKDHYNCVALQSKPDYDANYLKVVVTSGRACPNCKLDGIPYGNIIPGPIIVYNATTQEGEEKCAIAAQMYRSAHLPLDLPYTIFGIGRSPSFIDVLTVSWSPSKSRKTKREWQQLIPNSQIIITAPYPPSDWKGKIFLPSTKAPLHTFLVLLGFCGAIGIIALILQWRERREDRKGRLLETHRFMM